MPTSNESSLPITPQQPLTQAIDESLLVPFTCPWAQNGLAKALEGMVAVGDGVQGYGIGTRWVRRKSAAEQLSSIDYWQKMVELYCGTAALPTSVTGRDTAKRVILRDV